MVVMQELYTQYLSQYMQYMQTTTPVIQPEIQVRNYRTRSTCKPLQLFNQKFRLVRTVHAVHAHHYSDSTRNSDQYIQYTQYMQTTPVSTSNSE